jgi:hypothetical protein
LLIDVCIIFRAKESSIKPLKGFDFIRGVTNASVGIWGMILFSSEAFIKDFKLMNKDTIELAVIIQDMLWFRILYDLFFCVCQAIVLIFLVTRGIDIFNNEQNEEGQEESRVARHIGQLPMVSTFLQNRSRQYDPTKDAGAPECSICMNEFSSEDPKPIAELNCHNQHIFHLECIKIWCANNNICPLCRTPIL